MQQHPDSENGNPLVDMQTMTPTSRLDDPGIGLRDNGRRVLTYADLKSVFDDPDGREPGRTIELHLTGHMGRFAWSFNGVKFSDAEPLRLTYGERLRIVLVNDTMMTHPIHLHGMWSDIEDDEGKFHVRKHTVDMPPGTRRSYRVTADALGPLGVSLPPAVPHGSGHVPGSAGGRMSGDPPALTVAATRAGFAVECASVTRSVPAGAPPAAAGARAQAAETLRRQSTARRRRAGAAAVHPAR